ncbi:MAG: MBL fold metallo-hydrolase [Candidatus Sericytochromatia bacterium]|nr:MBL fold metallo-hydrolase [Candidatus Sericytochromatia bacterium]
MKVRFWGVRGSTPTPWSEAMQIGGNTSCVQLLTQSDALIILDAGTGLRMLGKALIDGGTHRQRDIHLLLSHTHWDHIQGIPFFGPLNFHDNQMTIYGANKTHKSLEEVIRQQMSPEYFPVSLDDLPAQIHFQALSEERFEVAGLQCESAAFNHPGGVYGFRIQGEGATLVYATDMEYTPESLDPRLIAFAQNADLLIYDAQYTPDELHTKSGWGHSTYLTAAQLAKEAGVKQLALFSHDPEHADSTLREIEAATKKYFPASFLACEGMVLDI